MLNWYLRYEPFVAVLAEGEADSVLDVGSGWFGLSWYSDRAVTQTDLHFDGKPPIGRVGSAAFVRASAEELPFVDDAFDWAISSDMLEHLPSGIRAESIRELTRVARRGVIVGFPQGRAASSLDRLVAGLIRLTRRPLPAWLAEHLEQDRYPSEALIRESLPVGWHVSEVRRNGNLVVQAAVVIGEMLPGTRTLLARLERSMRGKPLPGWVHVRPTVRALYLVRPDRGM